jgi:hypothetical protein
MGIDARKQSEFIIRYIKDAKRKVMVGAIIASIVSVLLFVLGSYYLLFRFYKNMTDDYYTSLLHSISSFQEELIERQTYRDDLKRIASEVVKRKGVNHVWFTDRFGRLIYSTDADLISQYSNERLPSQYFESVHHLWQFENGNPVPKVVPIERLLSQRFSIPIYANGREEYDFVMGIDVRRFIYLPQEMSKLLYISIGYILFFASLLFFPLFVWVKNRFSSITTQVSVMFGSLQFGAEKARVGAEPAPQPKPQDSYAMKTTSPETTPRKAPSPELVKSEPQTPEAPLDTSFQVTEKEAEEPQGKQEVQGAGAREEAKEKQGEISDSQLALFARKKKEIFISEDIQLQFIHASSYVHHSNGIDGTYIYTHRGGEKVYFISFEIPYANAGDAIENIDGLISYFTDAIKAAGHIKDFTESLNGFCRERALGLTLSAIAVDIGEKSVRYGTFGTGRALYVKKGSNEVKELAVDMPRLGLISDEVFNKRSSYADIRFSKDDLFLMLPQNIDVINIGEEMIKTDLLTGREQSASEICSSIGRRFQQQPDIQQTGFVIVKFV